MEFHITKERLEELKGELETEKKEGRNEIADRLKRAKEFGDLSENAEYSEAKEAQAKLEAHIIELENIIRNSVLIKKTHGKKTIDLGATVKVEKDKKTFEYTIVGSNEANPEKRLISNESPLGAAFMGKKEGDVIDVETPRGMAKYKILEIE
ncbi:MAG: Transcription elongation factor [uncultured bacterium]|uniref:Transcription elongation factor GreA n=2 Tax=Candidatus Wolfeibacteriota TaxID=1752735 RepID=A0A0G1H7D8_9BACT|nr:MAG: Transcription elongation factor [uncultured bacterium]KKR13029.1 MAG: Transcription elongation factor GreA [Candidatus Wolfebacteria bacterium GW2011_GWC2_39_22]KKT42700.1 MAG: Transcription elongation factor GreA [Candidatus Wolfebacteria bacterium GW2011_GWE2_44_13]HBI25321.1 transcription elongation factor GreA [Candidatus Wolfebacteria bacterium]HBI26096.1 transcription elongation factor GreA [Candidatus Wolfebacteria bacterium]